MVKAYLRYESSRAVGVITGRECNVALDRQGKCALAGVVDTVIVWSLRQGAQVKELKAVGVTERVTRICVKDGVSASCAVGYADGSVRLWNFAKAALLQTLQGHRSAVSCLAFDGAGLLLASGGADTDVVVWDLAAESGIARLRGHVDKVTAVLFWEGSTREAGADAGPPARLISASKDRFVRIWSIELQLCLQTLPEHQVEVWSVALNGAQTRLIAGSADKFLRLWALFHEAKGSDEEPLAVFLGAVPRPNGQGGVVSMQYARPPNLGVEVLLCLGAGKILELFHCHDAADVKRRQKRRKRRAQLKQQKKTCGGPSTNSFEAAPEKEGATLGDATDDGPRAADELSELPPYRLKAKAMSMAGCPAGVVAIGLSNNSLESLRLASTAPGEAGASAAVALEPASCVELPGHRTAVRALAVAHDDSLVMSVSAEALKVWSAPTGRCIRTMPSGYGLCGFFVAGNEHVVLGTKEGHLELYDLRVAELCQTLEAHAGAIYGVAENPEHTGFVSCSADKQIRFFSINLCKAGAESVTLAAVPDKMFELTDECLAVRYSPNGTWVAVALLNQTVTLLFADSLKFYISLYGHRLPVMCLDFSSDSQIMASGSADKNIKLWSTHFGNCLRSLRAHGESVMQVAFLPGTHYLASAGRDRELKIWDCDSYELITALRGHASEVLALALSQDAAFIVTASSDRQLRFWCRTQDQLFLVDERAKELEEQFEREAERDDVHAFAGADVVSLRPSRRTLDSLRSTEQLMGILDKATAAEADAEGARTVAGKHPCAYVVGYVNTLTSGTVYEVLLALPFGHAVRLLGFLSRYFEAVARSCDADDDNGASAIDGASAVVGRAASGEREQARLLSAATALEAPCQAALIAAYVHHGQLAATSSAKALVVRLREQMRTLLQAEKDRIGLSIAGLEHLQRFMKCSSNGFSANAPVGPARTAAKAGSPPKAKRRRREV